MPRHTILKFTLLLCMTVSITTIAVGLQAAGSHDPLRGDAPVLPATPYNYENLPLPNHFNQNQVTNIDNTPANNQITDEAATLGRVLFYDVKLSANDTTSCASCHLQEHAFADPNQFSVGFEGGLTGRHSMGLANARYYENGAFFWDERADTLEDQTLMPIQDPIEMGMDLTTLEAKLAATSYYPVLFEDAFGTNEVTSQRISRALAQFIRSIVSYQSRFDEGVPINFDNFTAEEQQGRQIFDGQGRCDRCHETVVQALDQPRNTGLDAETIDPGVGGITGNPNDDAEFKVPSLRNVELRPPYMHDGRFNTLEEVVEFYNSGVQPHPNLDNNLQNQQGDPRRLNLNQQEKDALVAFLETLTDEALITDVKYSDPFTIVGPSPTPTMTNTPVPTETNTPVATSTNTPVATSTNTPIATSTNTPVATSTNTPIASNTPTNTPIVSNTPTNTPIVSNTPTNTPIVSNTPTNTPIVSNTPTATPAVSNTPTATPAVSNTPTATVMPSATPVGMEHSIYLPVVIR